MDQDYCEVLASVRRWIAEKQQEVPACIMMQHIIESENALRVLINAVQNRRIVGI